MSTPTCAGCGDAIPDLFENIRCNECGKSTHVTCMVRHIDAEHPEPAPEPPALRTLILSGPQRLDLWQALRLADCHAPDPMAREQYRAALKLLDTEPGGDNYHQVAEDAFGYTFRNRDGKFLTVPK